MPKWPGKRIFSQTLDIETDLGIRAPELEYILIDLSRIPDHLVRERLELELALAVFRHIRDEDIFDSFQRLLPLLGELGQRKTCLEYIETILRYVYYVRSEREWNGLVDLFHQTDPIIEEIAMTTIEEHLIQQGEAAGIQKGLEEGKLSEAHDVLLELLEEQFGVLPLRLTEKLHQVQNHGVLRMLLRQRKGCRSLDEFEQLLEKALL
jgi:hypothetical protein